MTSIARTWPAILALLLIATPNLVSAQDPETAEPSHSGSALLIPELAPLRPFLGNWEIEATWSSGEALWGRNEFSVTLGGKFVEAKTFAKDGTGDVYHRYTTLYGWDAEQKQIVAHGFTHDGTTSHVVTRLKSIEGGGEALTSTWKPQPDEPLEIKQQVDLPQEGQYHWQVWMRPAESAPFEEIMDGSWKRK